MTENHNPQPEPQPTAEGFGNVPNHSEGFGTVRNHAETFGSIPQHAERMENHTLTVREAARMFEAAGVARTERSIINWCQLNSQGVARLHAYFDPNERKYFITPQSVELAIAEEKAKVAKQPGPSEPIGTVPNDSEKMESGPAGGENSGRVKTLEQEVMDLKIINKGKDFFIQQLQKERESNVEQLMTFSRKVGELETKLLQLSAPRDDSRSSEATGENDLAA